jgi:outer membrane protein assembly factor BamA
VCAAIVSGVLLLGHPAALAAPPEAQADSARWTFFPLVALEPETSWVFGAFALRHFDSSRVAADPTAPPPRRSNVGLVGLYSLKHQFLLALEPTLYLAGGRHRLRGAVSGAWFPNTFYAIGPHSPAESAEPYEERTFRAAVTPEHRLAWALYVGFQLSYVSTALTRVAPGGALASGRVPGSRGGEAFGLGPLISWDTRDRDSWPRRGGLHTLSWLAYPRLLGGDYRFGVLALDARQYVPLPGERVLALQLYTRHSGGDVPFQALSALAGDGRLRGFFGTRYIDKHTTAAQLEVRAPLFWRLSGVVFFAAGHVAPRLGAFDWAHPKLAGGPGLRLALNPEDGVNLRFDYGLSSDGDQSAYVQIGEAF